MPNRAFVFISVLIASAVGAALAAFAQSSPATKGNGTAQTARIEFYLAHGEPGACGPDCDEWIAAEGKIDAIAFDRLRQLLDKLGPDRKPPIFLNSPGGSLSGSLALGRLIREKNLETSVGHTVPLGCDTDKPDKLQACSSAQSGSDKPVQYEISQFMAQCNSGCVYALAGGVTHLVPPWVKLAIHDAGLDPNAELPSDRLPILNMAEAHRRMGVYLREMGIDAALFSTILATPFEMPKLLQRDDIVRFGLDRREFGETGWQLVDKVTPQIRKRFFVRTDGEEAHFVNGVLQITCVSGLGMTVAFGREPLDSDADLPRTVPPIISIAIGGKKVSLRRSASPKFYVRVGGTPSLDGAMETTTELPAAEFGRKELGDVTLSMEGFSAAYAKLRQRCNPQAAAVQAPAGLQNLVQQFQAHPERYGGTPAEPGAVGIPVAPAWPAAVAPVTNKQPPIVEFSRFATAEQKLRIDFLFLLKPDCSSAGKEAVGVIEQPQHGTLTIETSQGLSDFPEKDPRAACNTSNSDAIAVFYQANKDYEGSDSASVSIAPPLGAAVTHHYTIRVK
jgi:hypothetical protein